MERQTFPEGIPRPQGKTNEDFDLPPCAFDEEGCTTPPRDPLYDERGRPAKPGKHAMHEREHDKERDKDK
jgi:hypothetical protein